MFHALLPAIKAIILFGVFKFALYVWSEWKRFRCVVFLLGLGGCEARASRFGAYFEVVNRDLIEHVVAIQLQSSEGGWYEVAQVSVPGGGSAKYGDIVWAGVAGVDVSLRESGTKCRLYDETMNSPVLGSSRVLYKIALSKEGPCTPYAISTPLYVSGVPQMVLVPSDVRNDLAQIKVWLSCCFGAIIGVLIWPRVLLFKRRVSVLVLGLLLAFVGDVAGSMVPYDVTLVNEDVVPHTIECQLQWQKGGWYEIGSVTVDAGSSFVWSGTFVPHPESNPRDYRWVTGEIIVVKAGTAARLFDATEGAVIDGSTMVLYEKGKYMDTTAFDFAVPFYLQGAPKDVTLSPASEGDFREILAWLCVFVGVVMGCFIWPKVFGLMRVLAFACVFFFACHSYAQNTVTYYWPNSVGDRSSDGYQDNIQTVQCYVPNGSPNGTYRFSWAQGATSYVICDITVTAGVSNCPTPGATTWSQAVFDGQGYVPDDLGGQTCPQIQIYAYGPNGQNSTLNGGLGVSLTSIVFNAVAIGNTPASAIPPAITGNIPVSYTGIATSTVDCKVSFVNTSTAPHVLSLVIGTQVVASVTVGPASTPGGTMETVDFGPQNVGAGSTVSYTFGSATIGGAVITPGQLELGSDATNGGYVDGDSGALPVSQPGTGVPATSPGSPVVAPPTNGDTPPATSTGPTPPAVGAPTGGGGSGGLMPSVGGGTTNGSGLSTDVNVLNVDDFYNPFFKALEDIGSMYDPAAYNDSVVMTQPTANAIFGGEPAAPSGQDGLVSAQSSVQNGLSSVQSSLVSMLPAVPTVPTSLTPATLTWSFALGLGTWSKNVTLDLEPFAGQISLIRDLLSFILCIAFWLQMVRTIRGAWTTADGN